MCCTCDHTEVTTDYSLKQATFLEHRHLNMVSISHTQTHMHVSTGATAGRCHMSVTDDFQGLKVKGQMFHAVQAERSIEPASMRTQFRLMHDYLLLFLYVSWRKELLDTIGGKDWLHYSFIHTFNLLVRSQIMKMKKIFQDKLVCVSTTELLQILTQTQA